MFDWAVCHWAKRWRLLHVPGFSMGDSNTCFIIYFSGNCPNSRRFDGHEICMPANLYFGCYMIIITIVFIWFFVFCFFNVQIFIPLWVTDFVIHAGLILNCCVHSPCCDDDDDDFTISIVAQIPLFAVELAKALIAGVSLYSIYPIMFEELRDCICILHDYCIKFCCIKQRVLMVT